ncbi:MAG: N-formylglutamate amidohydrolase [Rhizobiaceae bacterium]
MGVAQKAASETVRPVEIERLDGASPYVFVCDHASNFVPADYGTLGLDVSELTRHIAWDPGALPVSRGLSSALDATLVHSGISRLVIDCNRPVDAPDLFWTISETTVIPGNQGLDEQAKAGRIALAYTPFHDAIDHVVRQRLAAGRETWLVSVHSFTPVYRGVARPWHIGVIHDGDERLSAPLMKQLAKLENVTVGDNEPYSPADRVYFTLEKHARSRGLPCAMIEIRNDEISGETGQRKWVERLAGIFRTLQPTSVGNHARAGRQSAVGSNA